MVAALLLFIFIRPFISSLAFPYLNRIYSLVLLGFLLIWFSRARISFKETVSLRTPLAIFALAFLISAAFAEDKIIASLESYKYVSGIALLLAGASLAFQEKSRIIRGILVAALVTSALALYQYFFGFRNLLDYLAQKNITDTFILEYITRGRVFFPFVTPNILAGFLAMGICLALYEKKRIWFIIPLSCALLLTKSLSGLLSLAVALWIYFCLHTDSRKKKGVVSFVLFAVIVAVLMTRMSTPKQHLHPAFSTSMRLSYWRDTLKIIESHFLVGIGPGNFMLLKSRFAHNSYLQIWAEMGIGGIASFVWLLIAVIRKALGNVSRAADKTQGAALLAGASAFLVHNLFDFSFFLPEVSLIWWLIMGMLVTVEK